MGAGGLWCVGSAPDDLLEPVVVDAVEVDSPARLGDAGEHIAGAGVAEPLQCPRAHPGFGQPAGCRVRGREEGRSSMAGSVVMGRMKSAVPAQG